MTKITPNSSCPKKQQGMVLVIGLIMLLLMTIVGLAAIRGTGLQESMAGNMRDRNMAFQAAEAGLRVGEEYLITNWLSLDFNGGTVGLYNDQNLQIAGNTSIEHWTSADWTSANARTSGLTLEGISTSDVPLFVVEKLEQMPPPGAEGGAVDFSSQLQVEPRDFYRVTSRGLGGSGQSEAIIQTTIRP